MNKVTSRDDATKRFCITKTTANILTRFCRWSARPPSASIRSISAVSTLQEPSEALNTCAWEERSAVTGKTPLVIYSLFWLHVCGWSGEMEARARTATNVQSIMGEEGTKQAHRDLIGWPPWYLKKRTTTPTECSYASTTVKIRGRGRRGGGCTCITDGLNELQFVSR